MMPHHPAFDFFTEPCEVIRFKGKRVNIEQLMDAVAEGWSRDTIISEMAGVLTEAEIDTGLHYAATYPDELEAYMARVEERFRQFQLQHPSSTGAKRLQTLKLKYGAMAVLEGVDFLTVFRREQYQLAGDLHE